jgi:hypothetical protein
LYYTNICRIKCISIKHGEKYIYMTGGNPNSGKYTAPNSGNPNSGGRKRKSCYCNWNGSPHP